MVQLSDITSWTYLLLSSELANVHHVILHELIRPVTTCISLLQWLEVKCSKKARPNSSAGCVPGWKSGGGGFDNAVWHDPFI